MIQIRTTIGCDLEYLDTYGDEDIKIEVGFAEVQDITKKNSTFTKSFKLPGSKHNNDIFNHFYDFSASMYDYDVRRKFDCQLLLDGNILYEGYLRLNGATNDNNEIIYDVGFYSEVGNLIANIGDKMLQAVDFSDLSHNYNYFEVANSHLLDSNISLLDSPNGWENGKLYYSLLSKGYQYTGQTFDDTNIDYTDTTVIDWVFDPTSPNGEFGYMTFAGTPAQWYYLTPSIQIKEIYDRIYTGAGYNVQSEFMETDYFKNFYLPLTFDDDSIFVGQTIDPAYTFINEGNPPGQDVDVTPYTFTSNTGGGTVGAKRILHQVVTEDNFQATNSSKSFKIGTSGTYSCRVTFSGFNSEQYPETVPLDSEVQFKLRFSNGTAFNNTGLAFTSGSVKYSSGTLILPAGGFVQNVSFTFDFTHNSNSVMAYGWDMIDDQGVGDFVLERFKFEILEGPRQIVNGIIDPTAEFPCCQYKQIDFLASINQFFNMVTVPIPGDPKTLRVEPVIDFIGKGETLDWTSKVDRGEPIKVEPLTDIIEGTLNYMYEEDDGWANETYTKANNYVFGNLNVELNQDYKDKSTDFETEFGSEVDRVMEGNLVPSALRNYATSPMYFQRKDKEGDDGAVIPEFNPYRTTPKLLFKGPMIPTCTFGKHQFTIPGNPPGETDPKWWLTNVAFSKWRNQNRFTTYPFGINKFSHYTNWSDDKFDKRELNFAGAETLYNVYWEDYIQDLTNPDNRLVSMKMFFDPFEVSQLKFNEIINVDNTKFRLNSIKNYSLTERGLADVELIKLTKEYEPHRKLYYTFTPCDGSECDILYSHSDLQYGLYAFANKYVQVQGGCGCMYLTYSYDPPVGVVNYQPVLISIQQNSAFNPNGGEYLIFDSCEDCESGNPNLKSDCLNVYNNIIPEPTPTPSSTPCATQTPRPSSPLPSYSPLPVTPTPTPSITPSATPTDPCTCIEYEIYNSSSSQVGNYKYRRCSDSVVVGPTYIQPLETQYVCACENSIKSTVGIQTTGVGFCLNPIDPTPTPTPTVTTTNTPTPTHTPTPSPTPGGGTPTDYDVCNTSGTVDITVAYVECATGNLITVVIPAGECAEACACSDIAFIGPAGNEENMAVLNNGDCVYVCDRGRFNFDITSGGTVGNYIIQTRQTTYSGGTLTGAYYDGPSWLTASNADRNDYNNYVRNTPLNGGLYQVYQGGDGQGTSGFSQTFWSNTDNSWIVRQGQVNTGFNPIYFQSPFGSGAQVFYVSQNATGSTIYQGNFYPPNSGITFNNADQPLGTPADYFEYDDPCIQPAPTPTPSAYIASYYDLTPCGGGSTILAKAYYQPTLSIGNVVELSIGSTGCYEVTSVIPFPVSTTNVIDTSQIYSNCTNCTGGIPVSPTPTPSVTPTYTPTNTPTPTPTPSTSGLPATCTLYQITNNSFMSTTYKFKTCPAGIPQLETLGPLEQIQVCAITDSVKLPSGANATIGILGDCT